MKITHFTTLTINDHVLMVCGTPEGVRHFIKEHDGDPRLIRELPKEHIMVIREKIKT
ncbi:hypothetical protein HY496_02085 [Candidatus Woesearchaeota archaeon]|nr:hypothetical protein [Candidatus Woesearchaeota archaeon]